jgi:23S rRNA (adenine2503-C2)-methyltransferase
VAIDLLDRRPSSYQARRAGDGTVKFAFPLEDGLSSEAAYFVVPDRDIPHIACVSTQLGCAARCQFCSTAANGVFRNLSAAEILRQITTIADHALESGANEADLEISFMGMGEPLANATNVLAALEATHRRYPRIRRVALSTVGPATRITAFADSAGQHAKPVHLQISLHATSDGVRRQLIPKAPGNIQDLIEAGRYYHRRTGDRVCLNYILLDGINDSESDADWLGGIDQAAFIVKLTVLNDIPDMPRHLRAASRDRFDVFSRRLTQREIPHKIFRGDGLDVQASCGQLAARPLQIRSYEPLG